MCKECGCGIGGDVVIGHQHEENGHHHHHHDHHEHDHHHTHTGHDAVAHTVALGQPLLEKNDRLAEQNRGFFRAKNLLVVNVISSPGSGKTSLISATVEGLKDRLRVGVIAGDLATDNDAERLRQVGIPVVQITTGTLCHLDASMITKAADQLDLDNLDVLIVENVGNLVCPADFDLGETLRVVLLSVTEGEDKPLKYPPIFHSANIVLVTKSDLAEATEFKRDLALQNLQRISHHAQILELSSRTGENMDAWLKLLEEKKAQLNPAISGS